MAKINLVALVVNVDPGLTTILAKATPGDNVYVAGGVQLDITPGKISDPSALGLSGPTTVPPVTPGIFGEALGGYYAEVIPTTGGMSGYKIKYYAPGGTEIGAGAYPAAITGGNLTLAIAYTVS